MKATAESSVRCDFCAHRCRLRPGDYGLCGVRTNRAAESRLITTVYGQIQAAAVDPIEKKPLYHFLPGSTAFSVALGGCNFRCRFCQNDRIAFTENLGPPRARWKPEDLLAAWRSSGAPIIAFTYTEPAVWQDYLIDCAGEARSQGARIVMVTNGFLTPEAVERLLPVVDAFNIDLKGDDRFYRTLCRATGAPVLETIARIAPYRHLEVTTMLMERFHDDRVLAELRNDLAAAGVKVWHLSRFYPAGTMRDEPPTGEQFLLDALHRVGKEIPYLYGGNSRIMEYQQTLCPRCGSLCIARNGGVSLHARGGSCPRCGEEVYGVFE